MDKNRKIVISILILLVLSSVLAIIDISLNMQGAKREVYPIGAPGIGPGVGIVRVYGPIAVSDPAGPFEMNAGSDAVLDRLSQLESDGRIRAIVVRINSPGGTVAATQEIYDKLMRLRKKNIILVASMGELAASGGYYIASACNYIFANHGTITGSIGVIAMSPNLRGLFDKLGIRMNVIKSGRYKDILASYRELGPDERDLIQQMIDSSYQKFLKDVSLGRNVPIADIEPYADGRVMNGVTAVERKLVDGLGSMEDALMKARELAKLPEDSAVYDEIRSPLEKILMSMGAIFKARSPLEQRMLGGYPAVEYRYQP
jgi:protease-4